MVSVAFLSVTFWANKQNLCAFNQFVDRSSENEINCFTWIVVFNNCELELVQLRLVKASISLSLDKVSTSFCVSFCPVGSNTFVANLFTVLYYSNVCYLGTFWVSNVYCYRTYVVAIGILCT